MYNYRLIIQYDGAKYKGWQRLTNTDMTIQGKIENVLTQLVGKETLIIGSGRTDAGVHAKHQVANFYTKDKFNCQEIKDYLYHYLPKDIVVTDVREVDERFHARYNVESKTYVYRINHGSYHDPFDRKRIYHVPKKLDVDAMKKAANYFLGKRDFKSFTTMKSKKKSTVRTLSYLNIDEQEDILTLTFKGDGFLYNMVRIIVGTLIEVGLGDKAPEDIPHIFREELRSLAGPTAPAQGLFLMDVVYK